MSNQNLALVFVGTNLNAEYLKSALLENGIDCIVRDVLHEGAIAGFGGGSPDNAAQVFVDEKDFAVAEEIVLKLFEQEQ